MIKELNQETKKGAQSTCRKQIMEVKLLKNMPSKGTPKRVNYKTTSRKKVKGC